jgi:NADPH:quinone reductase-like Zn-dependent oxidoreductase
VKSGRDGLKIVEFPVQSPRKGEVLVKMRAASLNYRFVMIYYNHDLVTKTSCTQRPFDIHWPNEFDEGLIMLSDGASEVVQVGEDVIDFKVIAFSIEIG